MVKNNEKLPIWALWLVGWFILFCISTYVILGPISGTFYGKVDTPVGSAEVSVDNESEKVVMSVVYGFFTSLIITIITWGIVQIYKIKIKK